MWRSARRSSGGVVVAARVAQVLLSSGIRRVAALRERRVHRVSGDVEQTVGRTVRAYGSGALRPLCSALTGLRACIYDGNFEKVPAAARRQSGSAGWRMTVRAVCESCPCGTRPATRAAGSEASSRARARPAPPPRVSRTDNYRVQLDCYRV